VRRAAAGAGLRAPVRAKGGVTHRPGRQWQIINNTVYGVGGYGPFWNEHHRKRMKAVVTILTELVRKQANIPDVEFVVNMHDYNKLMRHPNATLSWGLSHSLDEGTGYGGEEGEKAAAGGARARARTGAGNGGGALEDSRGLGGAAGSFREHAGSWLGYDWRLHYSIYGNHFGNKLLDPTAPVKVGIFSATSCAFSYDISFPTTFYDFDTFDLEVEEIHNKSKFLFPWQAKIETAWFRGSCWYYKGHGRTAAMTMSEVAPELVDAAWYDEVRTEMLEIDGLAHFGDLWEGGRYKYLLHVEGHDFWSMRIRYLSLIRSVLLVQQLPCQEFYYPLFEPYVHFLPLRRDLGDLYEKVLWARRHDEEAQLISRRLVERARQTMTKDSVLQYVHMLLTRYSRLLRYKVTKKAGAVLLDAGSHCLSSLVACPSGL
jgi:hypothetical protein